jgi:hypothetical protein
MIKTLKKYWIVFVGISVTIIAAIVYLLSRKTGDDTLNTIIEQQRDAYQEQIRVLEESYKNEQEQRSDAQVKYDETIAQIEQKYAEQKQELTETEKDRAKEILETYKDDNEALSQAFAKEFGFTYVKSEKK